MATDDDIPKIKQAPTAGMLKQAELDLEFAALRTILISLVGVVAADTDDVDKANGLVRRVELTAKEALSSYPVNSEIYHDAEFRERASNIVSGMLDALRFTKAKNK